MKKEFIPYEEALALKELGFSEVCFGFYYEEDSTLMCKVGNHTLIGYLNAPLYQQAFRWFREKYGFYSLISIHNDFKVMRNNGDFGSLHFESGRYNTYQEAQDACLRKLIEIVKAKQRR